MRKLNKLVVTDELTGALNKRGLSERLKNLFKQALYFRDNPSSERKAFLTIIFMDIDDFKLVNDTFGHSSGDIVLKEVASLIKKNIRETDFVGRYGGEEFIVALPGASESCGQKIAEKIRKNIEKEKFILGTKISKVTLSSGVASVTKTGSRDVLELIQYADDALYEAKNRGKNVVVKSSEIL